MSRPAVFLDRDGTIIEERDYLADPAGVALERNAGEGLRTMAALGYALVVISNQSGIARGFFTEAAASAVNRRLAELLTAEGVEILAWYMCPHGPDEGCGCRKPAPGLVRQAEREHDLDVSRSYVVGDKRSDLALADAVGATGILVETGHGGEDAAWARKRGFGVCGDLLAASALLRRRRG